MKKETKKAITIILTLILAAGLTTILIQNNNIAGKAISDLPLEYAKEIIKEKSIGTAEQIELYLKLHPEKTVEELIKDQEFRNISLKPVGKTGYTFMYDYEKFMNVLHPKPKFEGLNYTTIKDEPGREAWWEAKLATKEGEDYEGTYFWKDENGNLREKYQYVTIIKTRTADGAGLAISASTYLDEFEEETIKEKGEHTRTFTIIIFITLAIAIMMLEPKEKNNIKIITTLNLLALIITLIKTEGTETIRTIAFATLIMITITQYKKIITKEKIKKQIIILTPIITTLTIATITHIQRKELITITIIGLTTLIFEITYFKKEIIKEREKTIMIIGMTALIIIITIFFINTASITTQLKERSLEGKKDLQIMLAESALEEIEKTIEKMRKRMEITGENIKITNESYEEDYKEITKIKKEYGEEIDDIYILKEDGEIHARAPYKEGKIGTSYAQKEGVKKVIEKKEWHIQSKNIDETGVKSITMIQPIKKEEKLKGMIRIVIYTKTLTDNHLTKKFGETGAIALVDPEKNIHYAKGYKELEKEELEKFLKEKEPGTEILYSDKEGENHLITYNKLKMGEEEWHIMAHSHEEEAYKNIDPFLKKIWRDTIIAIIAIITIGIIFNKYLNRSLKKEIKEKTKELKKLNKELEKKVKERTNELETLNKELEKKVKERTKEIEKSLNKNRKNKNSNDKHTRRRKRSKRKPKKTRQIKIRIPKHSITRTKNTTNSNNSIPRNTKRRKQKTKRSRTKKPRRNTKKLKNTKPTNRKRTRNSKNGIRKIRTNKRKNKHKHNNNRSTRRHKINIRPKRNKTKRKNKKTTRNKRRPTKNKRNNNKPSKQRNKIHRKRKRNNKSKEKRKKHTNRSRRHRSRNTKRTHKRPIQKILPSRRINIKKIRRNRTRTSNNKKNNRSTQRKNNSKKHRRKRNNIQIQHTNKQKN